MKYLNKFIKQLLCKAGQITLPVSTDSICVDLIDAYKSTFSKEVSDLELTIALSRIAFNSHLRSIIKGFRTDLVIDVGANKGQFGQQLRRLGYTGTIWSFEPMTSHHQSLSVLCNSLPPWKLFKHACGEVFSRRTLSVTKDDSCSSFLTANEFGKRELGHFLNETRVESDVDVFPLDMVLENNPIKDFSSILLKTDTQGFDDKVLAGAELLLEKVSVVLCETAFRPIYENAPHSSVITSMLAKKHFKQGCIFPIAYSTQNGELIEADTFFVK
jgi:FkbM family methyltransferase